MSDPEPSSLQPDESMGPTPVTVIDLPEAMTFEHLSDGLARTASSPAIAGSLHKMKGESRGSLDHPSKRPSTATKKKASSLSLLPTAGEAAVGIHDVEVARSSEDGLVFQHGVLCSLLYPAATPGKHQHNAKWIPGPAKFYATGYGGFASFPRFLTRTVVSSLLGSVKMQAYKDAPLLEEAGSKIPVILFSHGLGGMRTTYCSLLTSLASRGFLVVSVEHRDGSASTSAYDNYAEPVEYINPKPEMLAPGQHKDDFLKKLRTGQVAQRVREMKAAMELVRMLNRGDEFKNLLGNDGMPNLKGRLDLEHVIMSGHSFGAATALRALQDKDQKDFIGGIVLDPWMFAVPPPTSDENRLSVPILSIEAEFFHWKENLEQFKALFDAVGHSDNEFGYIKGTRHQDISDFPSLAPRLMKILKVGGKTVPSAIFNAYDVVIMKWLRKLMDGHPVAETLPNVEDPEEFVRGDKAWEYLLKASPVSWEETKK
ncbi:Platelet-activating factor acetylhydrolase [Irineochytrium annulatum]|nr:Platelet-activating factor acetylhydrolase [Irineochytrium annulatum]